MNGDRNRDRKITLRAEVRERRAARAVTPEDADAIADSIAAWCAPGAWVTAYAAMPGEPPTSALLRHLVAEGVRVALPIVRPGRRLEWAEYAGPASLARSPKGIDEPIGQPIASDADDLMALAVSTMIVPALAVSPDGWRLGQGGGFYDVLLAELPLHRDGGPLRIALAWDDEVLNDVPHDEWDRRVDAIATPSGVRATGA